MSAAEADLASLHYRIVRGLIDRGVCPGSGELCAALGWSSERVESGLRGLAEIHGLVLHPHICEPWVVHPFSLTPTLNWVAGARHGWWAPCVWCAFGIAVLAGGEAAIHTRMGAEAAPVAIAVKNGEPAGTDDLWVHFAIPPAAAWQNVHRHCALVLPFRTRVEISGWCARHGVTEGEHVPLRQVAALARLWYGRHADPLWRKWTVAEAQEIFARAGLTSAFWNLGQQSGRY